ncbi:mannosyl-N-acetyl-alpha-D-glucosaminyl-diphospho-ditrans,octacis-undecaprenol 3-alpha-mannosyltransferase / alpha-1,3-rhamnosyltransferase [Tenacibaculum sp. 190524A05c]|uniref:glycosyltransferase family 4 protein n=1 Tax=Tenacibaculum platacis TaxID=3137852 RepID=UPI0031FB2E8D
MKLGFDAKRAYHNTTGLGNYSRDLLKILAAFYPDNSYMLYNPKPKKVDRLSDYKNLIEKLPHSFLNKKFSSFWRQGAIVNQLKQDKIDLYHGLSGEIPRNIKKEGIPSVVTIHDLIFVRYPELYSFFDRKIHYNKFKYAAQNADKVIAISEQTKNDIVEFLDIDASKIEVIYQGCHSVFKEIATSSEIEKVKSKFNLPEKFILNVGTIEERKNLLSIVKSIKNLDVHLVVVGRKTKYYDRVLEYVKSNQLTNRVHFLEGVDLKELSVLYQSAEIFVYPSIFEGFGIPIIEALYSKTPVITSKDGVFPEAGGPDSCYVDPGKIDEFTKAIDLLLKDETKRNDMIEKGHKFVQKFNDEVIANAIMKLYKTVLNEK